MRTKKFVLILGLKKKKKSFNSLLCTTVGSGGTRDRRKTSGKVERGCGEGSAGQLSISRLICSGYVQVSMYTHHIHTQWGLLCVQASARQNTVSTVHFQGRQGIANKNHFTGPSGPTQISACAFSFKHTHTNCLNVLLIQIGHVISP